MAHKKLTAIFLLPLVFAFGTQVLHAQHPPASDQEPRLTVDQADRLTAIHKAAEAKAGPAAERLAVAVKHVYDNMLSDAPDEALRQQYAKEMEQAVWAALEIKGDEIRQAVNLLTPAQKAQLRDAMTKPGAPSDLTEIIARWMPKPSATAAAPPR